MTDVTTRFFSRKATGLVREAGPRDTLVYNLFFGNPWLALVFVFLFAVPALAGANLVLSTFICLALVIPFLLVYAFLSAAIPRSGGEYTYISRIIHPVVAVMANLNITFFGIIFVGTAGSWFARWGVALFVRLIAVNTGSLGLLNFADWLSSTWGQFVVGSLLIVFFTLVFIRGMDAYLKIQRVAFTLGGIGLVAGAAVLLFSDHASFVSGFNHYAGVINGQSNTVSKVVSDAAAAGYSPAPSNFADLFRAVDWIFLALGYCYASTYIGGEIKRPARSQAYRHARRRRRHYGGHDHILPLDRSCDRPAFHWRSGTVPASSVGLPDTPTFVELIASISTNPLIWGVVGFCFIFWTFTTMPVNILTATRNLLAWALDGLAPKRFAYVSDRFHSPVISLVFVGVLGIFWLYIYIFTTLTSVILLIFANVLTYLTTAVAASLSPYRQRELFEASPVNWRWFGIPVVTIVGVIATITMATMLVVIFYDPTQGISLKSPNNLIFNLVVFFGGAVYFYVVYLIRKAQGVDLNLAFREIPVES